MLFSILSLLFSIVEVSVFVLIWCFLLLGVFVIVDRYSRTVFLHPRLSTGAAVAVTSSILFELCLLAHKYHEEHEADRCSWWRSMTASCESTISISWIWRLSVFSVVTSLVGSLIIRLSMIFGRSAGVFTSSLFAELPWLLTIPCALVTSIVIVFSVFALFGYELHVLGILRISPSRLSSSRKERGSWDGLLEKRAILPSPVDRSVTVIKELYQKTCSY